MQTSNGINLLGTTNNLLNSTSTTTVMWNPMVFKEVREVGESIEMIYTQTSFYHDERAVKIIYSCVDGKWNKSEPIFGKIVPAQDEYFEF